MEKIIQSIIDISNTDEVVLRKLLQRLQSKAIAAGVQRHKFRIEQEEKLKLNEK